MGRMRDFKDRTLSKNERMFLNYDDVTLLIKDMPIEDDERCGRLRDYLQTMIHGAAVKQKSVELNLEIANSRNTGIGDVAKQVQMTLEQIKSENELHQEHSVKVFDRLKTRIEESFISLGLTEEQEQHFLSIVGESVEESLQHIEAGLEIDGKLKNIIGKLAELSQ